MLKLNCADTFIAKRITQGMCPGREYRMKQVGRLKKGMPGIKHKAKQLFEQLGVGKYFGPENCALRSQALIKVSR